MNVSICVRSMGISSTRSFVIMSSVAIIPNVYLYVLFGNISFGIFLAFHFF